jgi:hypothetical protein
MTRSSITGQIKALSMIVAIEGLIPDRRARSVENKPVSPPPQIHQSAWRRQQQETTGRLQEDRLDDPPAEPAPVSAANASDSGSDPSPVVDQGEPASASRLSIAETQSRYTSLVPDAFDRGR